MNNNLEIYFGIVEASYTSDVTQDEKKSAQKCRRHFNNLVRGFDNWLEKLNNGSAAIQNYKGNPKNLGTIRYEIKRNLERHHDKFKKIVESLAEGLEELNAITDDEMANIRKIIIELSSGMIQTVHDLLEEASDMGEKDDFVQGFTASVANINQIWASLKIILEERLRDHIVNDILNLTSLGEYSNKQKNRIEKINTIWKRQQKK